MQVAPAPEAQFDQSASGTVCPDDASGQIWDQALLILF